MRVLVTFSEILAANRVGREIVVALDDDGVVALRDGGAVPGCFHSFALRSIVRITLVRSFALRRLVARLLLRSYNTRSQA